MTSPTRRVDPDAYPCQECGQRVTARQLHTYLHCVLYKNRINPADYGLKLVLDKEPPR